MSDFCYQHPGACECGAVRFIYHCQQALPELTARVCQCLYCLPRKASYLSDANSALYVQVKDRRFLYAHRFGSNTADFMHCAACNMQVYVCIEIEGHVYALVSAGALEGLERIQNFSAVDFDGESLCQRLLRRRRDWIPELKIHCADAV